METKRIDKAALQLELIKELKAKEKKQKEDEEKKKEKKLEK